jgi:hypothetical protein
VTEDELRELGGIPAVPLVSFLSQTFKLREDGLAALIRFARGSASINPEASVPLPVIYRLLEDTIIDFGEFSTLAMDSRADMADLRPVINHIIAWYCGRSHWAAMRLLGYAAVNLEEMDGQLIRAGGRGVAALSAREACNVVLAICLEGRSEDDRQVFMTDLMYEADASADALQQLRAFQRAQTAAKEAADGG